MSKKTLYRCPKCLSVIERTPELDELMLLVPEKGIYECGICGHFMPATEVLSGRYDIKNPELKVSAVSETQIPNLAEVLAKLKHEHVAGFVYRGQPKEWPGPLVSSVYRGMVNSIPLHSWRPEMRLREVGSTFHELLSTPITDYSPRKQAQLLTVNYLRQMFGYPLSQLLAQQCGLTSEGLDVTTDPDVAAFFATFDFPTGCFVETDDIGVIYRFRVPIEAHGVKEFKGYDLYNCPVYLNPDVLRLFSPCNSIDESLNSFLEYCVTYSLNAYNSSQADAERPLEALKIPFHALEKSRVVQQKAGLLMPDMILSKFYASLAKAAPVGKAEKEGENAIEDLATRRETEKFLFRHSPDSQRYVKAYAQRIFPKEDAFKMMLMAFLNRVIGKFVFITELGTFGNPGGSELLE